VPLTSGNANDGIKAAGGGQVKKAWDRSLQLQKGRGIYSFRSKNKGLYTSPEGFRRGFQAKKKTEDQGGSRKGFFRREKNYQAKRIC